MAKIARACGIDPTGASERELALEAPKAILRLLEVIGLPTRLSQIGIKEDQIPQIAEKALPILRLVRNNPRVPTQQGFEELLRKAL